MRGRPANENDPGSSLMMARLHRQPSYMSFYVAGILILAWVFGWSAFYSPNFINQTTPEMVQSFALLALPIGIVESCPISSGAPSNCARFQKS